MTFDLHSDSISQAGTAIAHIVDVAAHMRNATSGMHHLEPTATVH